MSRIWRARAVTGRWLNKETLGEMRVLAPDRQLFQGLNNFLLHKPALPQKPHHRSISKPSQISDLCIPLLLLPLSAFSISFQKMPHTGPGIAHDTAHIERFLRQIRNTLLFQVEWSELLSPGPRAMSNMGACFLAARATNPYLSLVGSLDSTHGLE